MPEEKKESVAPIRVPPSITNQPPTRSGQNAPKQNMVAPKKFTSKRKRRNMARKTQAGALNLRRVAGGFVILLLLATGFYLFTNPQTLPDLFAGKYFERTEVCTVTRVNTTTVFETSCGRFMWEDGNPSQSLVEGQNYTIHSTGIAIPITGKYPRVVTVQASP